VAASTAGHDPAARLTRGALYMLTSALLFGAMAVPIRLASAELHPFEIAFFRNLFGLVAALPILYRHGFSILRTDKLPLYFMRCTIGIVSMLSGFWALVHLPLAQAVAISYATPLFITIGAVLVLGVALTLWLGRLLAASETPATIFGSLQGLDALTNIVVVVGAGVVFLVTVESRAKRAEALADLHELRSIVHVIDMHQLTKDPTAGPPTANSPARAMTPFELTRYLDYCSELLSLAAKVAALYAQSSTDPVVIDAVNDLERLTTNLSQKIWQKITLVSESARLTYPPQAPRAG